MNPTPTTRTTVTSIEQLQAALADERAGDIVIAGVLQPAPTLRLPPGRTLTGADDRASLVFADGADGVQLTRDNRVATLRLQASPTARAPFNDTAMERLGTLELMIARTGTGLGARPITGGEHTANARRLRDPRVSPRFHLTAGPAGRGPRHKEADAWARKT